MNYNYIICPRCGEFFALPETNKFPVCRVCEYEDLIINPISDNDYVEYLNKYGVEKTEELKESFREQYVYNNPAFDKIWYNRRLSQTQQAKSTAEQTASNTVRCPQCGATNIQIVPRKWSMLTGFLTNKVDRVCLNCKNKF